MRSKLLAACVLAFVAAPSVARAQADEDPAAQARAAFIRGIVAVRARHYPEAAVAFEEAQRLRPAPVRLYHLARARELAGDRAAAVETYERYLAAGDAVDPTRRSEVQDTLTRLRRELQPTPTQTVVRPQPVTTTPITPHPTTPQDPPSVFTRAWFWAVVSAVVVGGLVVGCLAIGGAFDTVEAPVGGTAHDFHAITFP
jgi:hypothetical protein